MPVNTLMKNDDNEQIDRGNINKILNRKASQIMWDKKLFIGEFGLQGAAKDT
jgi:hypothetical protein